MPSPLEKYSTFAASAQSPSLFRRLAADHGVGGSLKRAAFAPHNVFPVDGRNCALTLSSYPRAEVRANRKETAMTLTHTVNVLMFCAAFAFVGAFVLGVF
jgi:hypothetical protein